MYKTTREASTKQEKAIAKAINGRRTPNSGATKFSKGDVVCNDILIEAKTCMEPKLSFSIKKDWLEKLRDERFAMNKMYSTLCFDFGDNKNRYYIIDEPTFLEFKEYIEREVK